ncbi:MAG: hypothetical protein WD872_02155 [Pirellulaceae bacterium]
MSTTSCPLSRRMFLGTATATVAAGLTPRLRGQAPAPRMLRIAAVNSIFRLRSHAYHIVGRMVHGFQKDGFHHQPAVKVVRMMNDQSPPDDLSRGFCERHGIELCESVGQTLGGDNLDVDAVLLIIEHGDYPLNDYGQVLYPRYEYFQKIVEQFRQADRGVPVFVDKHLSYDHAQAAEMVATAKRMKFPLMAGSSLPVTWRIPEIEPPLQTPFEEGVCTFGFDRGSGEIYYIHALETLQCMLERRKGGETGVKSVVALQGESVWKAIDNGLVSARLVEAALDRCQSKNVGPLRENVKHPGAILIEYADGTRGAALNLIEQTSEFGFAARVRGQVDPVSTCFFLPDPPGARFFDPLTWNIEQFFHTGRPPYPVERTLLTSTMLDLAMHSLKEGSKVMTGEALNVRYAAPADSGFFRGPIVDGA